MESPLAEWRHRIGIKQKMLARLAGVSQSHISKVERGKANISAALAAYLARVGEGALLLVHKQKVYVEYRKGFETAGSSACDSQGVD